MNRLATGSRRSRARIESRQGQPGQPDLISHKHVSKGAHLKCIQVEHNPKHADDGAACIVRFDGGDKKILTFGNTMRIPKDGEVYLECSGDRPTHCAVGIWLDTSVEQP